MTPYTATEIAMAVQYLSPPAALELRAILAERRLAELDELADANEAEDMADE